MEMDKLHTYTLISRLGEAINLVVAQLLYVLVHLGR